MTLIRGGKGDRNLICSKCKAQFDLTVNINGFNTDNPECEICIVKQKTPTVKLLQSEIESRKQLIKERNM